jgi:Rrf2 family nitric oxide-sensitive transcriptional repressor
MQLTKHTDFAFRTLIYLASTEEDLTTIQAIADRFGISKSHAMKIVNKLVHAGWIRAVRGKNGGISLGCDPREISLTAVIKLMETTLEPVNCHNPPCLILNACVLKGVLSGAQQAYFDYLEPFTLAQMLNDKTQALLAMK